MYLNKSKFIVVLIMEIFLLTSFTNAMMNEKEIKIEDLWAALESNKDTDLALKKSAYIEENIGKI